MKTYETEVQHLIVVGGLEGEAGELGMNPRLLTERYYYLPIRSRGHRIAVFVKPSELECLHLQSKMGGHFAI